MGNVCQAPEPHSPASTRSRSSTVGSTAALQAQAAAKAAAGIKLVIRPALLRTELDEFKFKAKGTDAVGMVLALLADQVETPVRNLRLLFADEVMELHVSLLSAGVHDNAVLVLEELVDPGSIDVHGAAASGEIGQIRRVSWESPERLDDRNAYGLSPLYVAIKRGREAVATELLQHSDHVEVDVANKDGRVPLYWAARDGRDEIVKLLLSKGATGDYQDAYGYSPLHIAAEKGRESVVVALIEGSADVMLLNEVGESALHLAAASGHAAVVALLLQAGADKQAQRSDACTPAQLAERNGHDQCLGLLRGTPTAVVTYGQDGERLTVKAGSATLTDSDGFRTPCDELE